MNKARLCMLLGIIIISLTLVGVALAADTSPQKETPPVNEPGDPATDANGSAVTSQSPCANWPGPDGYGYTGETIAYSWVEISASGSMVLLGDDDYAGPFPIGFNFEYYGNTYTNFFISSNGFISFGTGISALTNQCPLPDGGSPDNLIAMMWDDLDPGDSSDPVYYKSYTTCPIGSGPCLVVQYEDFCHYPGGPGCSIAGTWETILYGNPGEIRIQFEDSGDEAGSGSTTGIEGNNPTGDTGLAYACNTDGSLTDGTAIQFLYPAGVILSPSSVAQNSCSKSDVTYTLTLRNYTGSDATFNLNYTSGWQISGPAQAYVANMSSVDFDVNIHVPCSYTGDIATVTASANGFSDSSTLTTSPAASVLDEWEDLEPINGNPRSRLAGEVVNGKVYVIGGEILGGRANTVEEFDPATGNWTTKAGLMPTPASNVCAAAIGEDIYVPGGSSAGLTYLATLQVYHVATDTWETVVTDPLPQPKYGLGCAALDGKLYVFGGTTTGSVYTGTSFVYDPVAAAGSRWTALSNMNYARSFAAGVMVNGKIYAIGGRDDAAVDLAYVEAYDPVDSVWHQVISMNHARGGPGAYIWGETLIVCGGGWNTYLSSCEFYNTTQGYAGSWSDLSQTMNTGRRTFAYASLPDGLYAVAGYIGDYLASAERLAILGCPTCLPPSIEVSPLSLSATQPPNRITTTDMQVCNVGEYPLEWFLLESLNLNYGPHQPTIAAPTVAFVNSTQSDMAVPFEGFLEQMGPGLEGSAGHSGFVDPEAVLWDNGPLVTHPANCGAMDSSAVQTALGMSVYGIGNQFENNQHIADDFTITAPNVWDIQQIKFFSYQTNAPLSPSPFSAVYYQIWDGAPNDPASQVVFGDLVTNRLVNSTFSNGLRVLDTGLCNTNRYIFINTASAGISLPPGTYWIEWMMDGDSLFTGPWAPPITILGQIITGNALQFTTEWQPVLDTGTNTQQGFPFIIEGNLLSSNISWLAENPVSGVTLGGTCSNVDVNFDSTGLLFGDYSGELFTYSEDPSNPSIDLPVHLTVDHYRSFLPLTSNP